jgi:lambda family phage minor tail protein L
MTSIVSELQLLSPSAIIELFELQTTLELHGSEEIYRFHSGVNMRQANGDIIWNGNAYSKFPIEADGFEFNGKQMPRPTLRVANLFSSITAVLLNVNAVTPGNDLIGATVTRIRTCARYLDAVNFENNQNPFGSPDPTAEAPREIYKIDRKVSENRDLIEFELAAAIDLVNVSLPGRQCISSICQWKYRGPECGYTGANVFDELDEPANLAAATNFPAGTSSMAAGGELNVGDFLISSNRWYKLIMQADGNLVVYNKALKAVWSTLTYDKGASVFRYQEDGNLVIYDAFNRATWNSNTQNVASIDGTTFVKLLPDEYPTGDEASLPTIAATNFAAGTSSVLSTAAPRTREVWPGESLTSSNGWYQMLMQRDGNLVVYNKANVAVWVAEANGQPSRAIFQEDGNLVLYRYSDGAAIWDSGSVQLPTSSTPAADFTTGTAGIIEAGSTSASKLTQGQQIFSPNGYYRLKMQSDGNLVLYSKGTIPTGPAVENYNIAVWSTGTDGSGATYAHFQTDGNLALYTAGNVAVYQSNKGSYPQYAGKKLQLQNDGNLVIYGTGASSSSQVPADNFSTGTGEIPCANLSTSKLQKGEEIFSPNGWYRLKMQNDGNLVLYSKGTNLATGPASENYNIEVWNTGTYNTAAHYAYFQADGNLVLYDISDTAVWWLNKGQYGQWLGHKWQLTGKGVLQLVDINNAVLWRSSNGFNAEPTKTVVASTTSEPLWNTATAEPGVEPATLVFPTTELSLSDYGTLQIYQGATKLWDNEYSNLVEPTVRSETGDNRQSALLWEILGSADDQSGQTKNVNYTFTSGNRTVVFNFNGTANIGLPGGHYSGQAETWALNSATYVSSTGKWYLDEFLDLLLVTSDANPFRNHPDGIVSPVGRQYRINGVLSDAGSLIMQDDGNLVQYDSSSVAIWNAGYFTNVEPEIASNLPGFVDVCGKRLSSCEVRFGANADLPFGGFPGVGQRFD